MKKYFLIITLLFLGKFGYSQVTDTLELSLDFNVFLVFETEDIKFNFASSDIKVSKSGNKLILEGLLEDFYTTNLLVEADHKFYMFIIKYSAVPKKFIWNYQQNNVSSSSASASVMVDSSAIRIDRAEKIKQDSIDLSFLKMVEKIDNESQKVFSVGTVKYQITAAVTNINIIDDQLVVKISYQNRSDINFDISYFEILIAGKQNKIKKNATDQLVIPILFQSNTSKIVPANESITVVYIIDKVTLSRKKNLVVTIVEENTDQRQGDRGVTITIPFSYINSAKSL
jgi:hypothetical protein